MNLLRDVERLQITRLPNGSLMADLMSDFPTRAFPRQFHEGETVQIIRGRQTLQAQIINSTPRIEEYGDGVKPTRSRWFYTVEYNAGLEQMMGISEYDLLTQNPRVSGELLSLLQATTPQQAAVVAKYAAMESALAQMRRQMDLLLGQQDAIYDPANVYGEVEKWYAMAGAALHLGQTPDEFASAAD